MKTYFITGGAGFIGSTLTERLLKEGNKVPVAGFGTFSVSNKKGYTARNPRTGEPVEVAAR